ncbi:MAG: OmpA family protein, partial [Pseudomonadota bacterium]
HFRAMLAVAALVGLGGCGAYRATVNTVSDGTAAVASSVSSLVSSEQETRRVDEAVGFSRDNQQVANYQGGVFGSPSSPAALQNPEYANALIESAGARYQPAAPQQPRGTPEPPAIDLYNKDPFADPYGPQYAPREFENNTTERFQNSPGVIFTQQGAQSASRLRVAPNAVFPADSDRVLRAQATQKLGGVYDPLPNHQTVPNHNNIFLHSLANEYRATALYLSAEFANPLDRRYFERKASEADAGKAVYPEDLNLWDLQEGHRKTLSVARQFLLNALDLGGRYLSPQQAARAQSRYDCWVAQIEELPESQEPLRCQSEFEQALLDVRAALANRVGRAALLTPGQVVDTGPEFVASRPQFSPAQSEYWRAGASVAVPQSLGYATGARGANQVSRYHQAEQSPAFAAIGGLQNSPAVTQYDPPPPRPFLAPISIFFDFDSDTLSLDAQSVLRQLAQNILHGNYQFVDLFGYTDSIGNPQYNQDLAFRRANSVKDYLIESGIHQNAFSVQAVGEAQQPVNTSAQESRNRVVVVYVR